MSQCCQSSGATAAQQGNRGEQVPAPGQPPRGALGGGMGMMPGASGLIPRTEAERKAVEELLRRMRQDMGGGDKKKEGGDRKEFKRDEQNSAAAIPGDRARVVVRLPADARLWVDQVECPLPGTVRSFDTPNLDPQQSYGYTLRIAVQRDGQLLQDSRRVSLMPGQRVEVDFNDVGAARTVSTE